MASLRAGSNSDLGSFAIADIEESDGANVINVLLGENYPAGLLVMQDGSNFKFSSSHFSLSQW